MFQGPDGYFSNIYEPAWCSKVLMGTFPIFQVPIFQVELINFPILQVELTNFPNFQIVSNNVSIFVAKYAIFHPK